MQLKPSDFTSQPFESILQKSESETVALNIMKIRKRLGDKWDLTWSEYKSERLKDGNFSMSEKSYFDQVYPLIADQIGAIAFAPDWTKDARKALS